MTTSKANKNAKNQSAIIEDNNNDNYPNPDDNNANPNYMILGGDFIDIDLRSFNEIAMQVLRSATQRNNFLFTELKFTTTNISNFSFDSISNIYEMYENGLCIFDYFIAKQLISKGKNVVFKIREQKDLGTFTEYTQSLFVVYFMLMTRGKLVQSENERLPRFLVDYCNVKISMEKVLSIVSENDISKMEHTWIRYIDLKILPKAVQQRLMSGIAGYRIFNIFKSFKPSKLSMIKPDLKIIYDLVRKIAEEGPFYEMHPFFMDLSLASISISKNLTNLILDVYTESEIESMVNNKALYSYPKRDNRYTQYLQWKDNVFESMITNLLN